METKRLQQCRLLHKEEVRNYHNSRAVVSAVKCRQLQWVGHMARTGEARSACRRIRESLLENSHLHDGGGDVGKSLILRKTSKIRGREVSG